MNVCPYRGCDGQPVVTCHFPTINDAVCDSLDVCAEHADLIDRLWPHIVIGDLGSRRPEDMEQIVCDRLNENPQQLAYCQECNRQFRPHSTRHVLCGRACTQARGTREKRPEGYPHSIDLYARL
jgi:hypothetical protein